jgi:hypothetical protein
MATSMAVDVRLAYHREVVWIHGIVGGLIAGIVSLILTMFLSLFVSTTGLFATVRPLGLLPVVQAADKSFWNPARLIGSVWTSSLNSSVGYVVLGIATGLVAAVILGLVYSYLIAYIRMEPVVSGLIYGALTYAFVGVLLLNTAFPNVYAAFTKWVLFVGFMSFGLVLGIFEDFADRRRSNVRPIANDIEREAA